MDEGSKFIAVVFAGLCFPVAMALLVIKLVSGCNISWWIVILPWIPVLPFLVCFMFGILIVICWIICHWILFVYDLFTEGLD